MDLDQSLDQAAPPVSAVTPQLQRELHAMVAASEPTQRGRRPVRLAVVGGVIAGIVGLGTVASASGLLPGWTMFTTSSGQTCEVAVKARMDKPGDGEPISATFSVAERKAAFQAANAFLEDLDYASIDRQAAIAKWRAIETRIRDAHPDAAPRLQGDDLEVSAVTREVIDRMRSELAAKGLHIRAVDVIVTSSGCDL
jgi:hypothetical protein